ncbi:MAG: arsenic efflux protein [Clostridia bacterium]|nr:arsenic efflux protein [Clostridia bacterium]
MSKAKRKLDAVLRRIYAFAVKFVMSVILDAFWDTLKLFPFLYLIYILMEILEHRTKLIQSQKILQGGFAPLIGSATGLIPQCGFSVMAAKLYDRGYIRTGTILAVFIATSDEALIIMISDMTAAPSVMLLVLIKLIVSVGVGYLANSLLPKEKLAKVGAAQDVEAHFCCSEHDGGMLGTTSDFKTYIVSPLLHSLKIAAYLLIVNLVFGYIIDVAGGVDKISASAMEGGAYVQPLITGLIGLIPNCASSVILTGAYTNGAILFGSLVGGLCSNAGLGLVVLFRNTKKLKRNILLVVVMYVIAVVVGIAVNGFMALLKI